MCMRMDMGKACHMGEAGSMGMRVVAAAVAAWDQVAGVIQFQHLDPAMHGAP